MFSGSLWSNEGRDGFKDIFNLEMDESVTERDYDKVIISCCLENFW